METFNCSMCVFNTDNSALLIEHIVRLHKNSPRLKVHCFVDKCGATYTKWKSFQKHIRRFHQGVDIELDFNLEDEEILEHPDMEVEGNNPKFKLISS